MVTLSHNREYEARNEPAQKIKEEVEYHLAQQKVIESTLPSNIMIGPYHINTEQTRQALSKKRKALANSMLELLARRLRKQAEEVSEWDDIPPALVNGRNPYKGVAVDIAVCIGITINRTGGGLESMSRKMQDQITMSLYYLIDYMSDVSNTVLSSDKRTPLGRKNQ